jgi:menaquinone-dependent protoporphyrinogen oxidase
MTVLVAFATRHGSTRDIAEALAGTLNAAQIPAEARPIDEVTQLDPYAAVVIGSAVYYGQWMGEAHSFIETNAAALKSRPVWLFSSGPVGVTLKPEGDPQDVAALTAASGALGHRVFAGRLDRALFGFNEKLAAQVVRAPDGDYREWDQIADWAREIEATLRTVPAKT